MEFKEYCLRDLGEIVTGKTPSKNKPEFYNSGDIMFIKPDDLDINNIISLYKSKEYISKMGAEKVRTLPKDSVLVTCIGIIGKVGILNKDAAFNQQINAIIPNKKIIIPKYLAYRIWYDRNKLRDIANAPVVPIINKSQFSKFKISVPSFEYQKRVVELLEYAEGLINKRKSQIEALDQLTQSVFLEMFGDPIINPKKWKKSTLDELKRNIKYSIVDGPFGASLKVDEYVKEGIPVIRINNISPRIFVSEYFKYISEKKYEELSRSKVEKGDILLARVGHTIGKSCIFNQEYKALLSTTGVSKISCNEDLIHNEFLLYQLNLTQYMRYIKSKVAGAGQPYLNLTAIKKFEVIVPPLNMQHKYKNKVEEINAIKHKLEISLKELEKNYSSILQHAFKGELFTQEKLPNVK